MARRGKISESTRTEPPIWGYVCGQTYTGTKKELTARTAAARAAGGVKLPKALFQIVILGQICKIHAAVIRCVDAVLGVAVTHKAIVGVGGDLENLQPIQIVARLWVLRSNVTTGFKICVCILLNMTAIVPDINVGAIYIAHSMKLPGAICVVFHDALPIPHLKQLLPVPV